MAEWLEPVEASPAPELAAALGLHPLAAQLLAARGFDDLDRARAFLNPAFYTPASPFDLPDMDAAAARIARGLAAGEHIVVWGDFDVDGQTATTLLVQTLRAAGGQVDFTIPTRAEGHGVGVPALARQIDAGAQLVVTCDTGVSAHEAVAYARSRGVDVVITDHHDLPPELPTAVAVVNPKRLPAQHPLATLPGVGVAYKLAEALGPGAAAHLDLAALGIVADVALLHGETRFLLQLGLTALRRSQRLGLLALLQVAGVTQQGVNEEHIGFELAPRLNALGRLGDAARGVELLQTNDWVQARVLAAEVDGLNAQRKLLTDQIFRGALAQIERDPTLLHSAALVLSHPQWHAGVIGIVASRLVERFHRPVVLLATPPGELARGSARSVEGCHIAEAIAEQSHLLHSFGGHPMAAGLTLVPEHIAEFRRGLSRSVAAQLGPRSMSSGLALDAHWPLGLLSLELVDEMERLAPFGPGNPRLVLASPGHQVVDQRVVGRQRSHRRVTVADPAGRPFEVWWWQGAGEELPASRFDLAYTPRASSYRGQRELQIEWVDARPLEAASAGAPGPQGLDRRTHPHPLALLAELRRDEEVQVWCEGEARRSLQGRTRHELHPSPQLVIWTSPPSQAVLRAVLAHVQPHQVIVFAVDAGLDQMDAFAARLSGLVKHSLAADAGAVNISRLAAAMAHDERTIRAGLRWLAARGHVHLERSDDDRPGIWQLLPGDGVSQQHVPEVTAQVRALLAETAAYRRHWRDATVETLLE